MKKHYLTPILFLFYVCDAAALPDCPSSYLDFFDDCYGSHEMDNGSIYVGEWQNDLQHGQGSTTFPDGSKYVGEYKNGQKNGQGTFTWIEDGEYVGEFKDDKMHGQGTYTHKNGFIERGYYLNDEYVPEICEGMGLRKGSDAYGKCVLKLMNY